MCFAGLQGMIDPPKQSAIEAVEKCKQAGIRTVMITGDHPDTAQAVAKQLGIAAERVVAGAELSRLSDSELEDVADQVSVFARVGPEHKQAIAKALQARGLVVAMTGDGVNDAPALKTADIGIAMGIHGTDVATEASDAVLLQDDLKRLPFLIALSKATHRAIVQNLLMAMFINAVAIVFAALGYVPPWAAAIIHNLGSVLVFLNSFRLANFKWQFATRQKPARPATVPSAARV